LHQDQPKQRMKIIPHLQISTRIMTLIEDAQKELFIVSPFVSIDKWDKMKNCLLRARERNVKIWFYVRKNADQNLRFLYEIGISPIFIENLHAKLYVNEQYGIVTSQNLHYYSDTYSIDIGYQTEGIQERTELMDFIDKAIKKTIESTKSRIEINEIVLRDYYKDKDYSLSKPVLEILTELFKNRYTFAKFYKKQDFLLSKNLFSFAEIELDCRYTLIFDKNNLLFEELTDKIRKINFDTNHKFRLNYDIKGHKKYDFLDIEPCSEINSVKLISDFEKITDEILEISKEDTEKQQTNKSKYRNVILNEQEFLEILYQRFRSKYPNSGIAKRDSYLFSEHLFSFARYVTIRFNCYRLNIENKISSKLVQEIINTFEYHQFKTNIDRRGYYSYFDFQIQNQINSIDLIDRLEKVTDNVLQILQPYAIKDYKYSSRNERTTF